jgi:hypothetical protein
VRVLGIDEGVTILCGKPSCRAMPMNSSAYTPLSPSLPRNIGSIRSLHVKTRGRGTISRDTDPSSPTE